MIFTETELIGAYLIDVRRLEDDRGFFGRSWCAREMAEHGLKTDLCQGNISFNHRKGTLRGIHFQQDPYQETKVVRCSRGSIYDVIIDLRKDSPTYMKWFGTELTADNYTMLYVPEDFGHGFITLEDNCEVTYLVTQFYMPGAERGIRWNDPAFGIKWPIDPVVISERDRSFPDYT
jgi:dTDP-4-dehydrorhamnose 3,5-epimerase